MRCAFLTMDSSEDWSTDAGLCIPYLKTLGWEVDWVPWRKSTVHWDTYDLVYLAAPWDYPDDPVRFMQVLEGIECSKAMLINDIELIRWNLTKTYLRNLQARGVAIVPSLWYERFIEEDLPGYFDQLDCEKIIIKPVISTNASNTFLLDRSVDELIVDALYSVFSDRLFMVQPFIENIRNEGEFSLLYIDGILSHAIQKIPKSGDFRVQEEHGGKSVSTIPGNDLQSAGNAVIKMVKPMPLYARADFVRGPNGEFLLMELELIEPSMYLGTNELAPQRFAHALNRQVVG